MKQFPLIQVGNPGFRIECRSYTVTEITSKAVKEHIKRMKYTMAKVHGVGLADPQVGIQKQCFVVRMLPTKYRPDIPHVRPYAVFNPVIEASGNDTQTDWEGCFSVAKAGLFAKVRRPNTIQVRYLDEAAHEQRRTLHGLEARIFQHEYDHLQGKIFLECDHDTADIMSADEYRAMRKRSAEGK